MVLVNGDVDKIIDQLKKECEEQDLAGLFLASVNKTGNPSRLDGKFFFFATVNTPFGHKGIFVAERNGQNFEDPIPLMVIFEDEAQGGIMYEPFETNYITTEEMWGMLTNLKYYLEKKIPEKNLVKKNAKDLVPFLMPESKTIH